MRSDQIKKGVERAPNRSLLYALGYTKEELDRPLVGVVSSWNEIVPGHMDLDKIVERYKALDDEIARKELELKYECNSRLLDARKLFEDDRSRQIRRLSELDVFHDEAEDLFKL